MPAARTRTHLARRVAGDAFWPVRGSATVDPDSGESRCVRACVRRRRRPRRCSRAAGSSGRFRLPPSTTHKRTHMLREDGAGADDEKTFQATGKTHRRPIVVRATIAGCGVVDRRQTKVVQMQKRHTEKRVQSRIIAAPVPQVQTVLPGAYPPMEFVSQQSRT